MTRDARDRDRLGGGRRLPAVELRVPELLGRPRRTTRSPRSHAGLRRLHVERRAVRARHRHFKESLDDYDKAQRMDPINPELFYAAGVTAYEAVAKGSSATADQKRALIRRGLTSLQKAESMKPDYFEAMAYHNLLLRQQALLESDPAERKKLVAEADAIRERAISIIRRRKSGSTQPASTSTTAAPPTPTAIGAAAAGSAGAGHPGRDRARTLALARATRG